MTEGVTTVAEGITTITVFYFVLFISIALVVLAVALIAAIFTIKSNTVKQTRMMQEQTELLQMINANAQIELHKNVEKVQLSVDNGKIVVVTISDWLKRYVGKDGIRIENVS